MKKLVLITVMVILSMSSIGLCAVPDPSSRIGDIQMGYNYYGLNKTSGGMDQGRMGFNELYGTAGIGFGYGGFVTQAQAGDTSYTDFGIKSTMLIPNIALMAGQRRMVTDSGKDSSLFLGTAVRQNLVAGLSVYGTYQKGTKFTDTVFGLTYDMDKNSQMNLSWKNYDDHDGNNFRGIGGGVNFQF